MGDNAHGEPWLSHGALHPPLIEAGVIHLNTTKMSTFEKSQISKLSLKYLKLKS